MADKDCIFCKIIIGAIPARKVYEDADVIAILDINPISKGHVLVIPVEHTEHFEEMGGERYQHTMSVVQRVARALNKTYKPQRVVTLTWGFDVPHTHIHVLPLNDPPSFLLPRMEKPSDGELDAVAEELTPNV